MHGFMDSCGVEAKESELALVDRVTTRDLIKAGLLSSRSRL